MWVHLLITVSSPVCCRTERLGKLTASLAVSPNSCFHFSLFFFSTNLFYFVIWQFTILIKTTKSAKTYVFSFSWVMGKCLPTTDVL